MKKEKVKFLAAVLAMLLMSWFCAAFASDGDWQFRTVGSVNKAFNPNWKLIISQQTHFGKAQTAHNLFKSISDVSLWYIFNSNWSLSFDYKQEYSREEKVWLLEKRPHWNLRYRW